LDTPNRFPFTGQAVFFVFQFRAAAGLRARYPPLERYPASRRRAYRAHSAVLRKGHTMTDDVKAPEAELEGPKPNAELDNDPMLVEMREAEKEIAGKGKDAEAPVVEAEPEPKAEEGHKPSPMIPKARLDEVLADREVLKGQVGYWQGVAATQKEMLSTAPKAAEGVKEAQPAAPTDYAGIIAKAENDKISAAKRYEDGEISLVDFKTLEIQQDRIIREQAEKRTETVRDDARKTANETVNAHNVQRTIETEAISVQEQHPYVGEIDKLPPAIRDGVWSEITKEAVASLAAKGINAADGTTASRLALIQEKANLTDKYGPQYTGKTIERQKTGQSDTAIERAAKLDLSTQQPPSIQGNVQAIKSDLTEKDIENMSQDQIADMMLKAPQIAEKAAGFRNR
jgi:hypothetical protein